MERKWLKGKKQRRFNVLAGVSEEENENSRSALIFKTKTQENFPGKKKKKDMNLPVIGRQHPRMSNSKIYPYKSVSHGRLKEKKFSQSLQVKHEII